MGRGDIRLLYGNPMYDRGSTYCRQYLLERIEYEKNRLSSNGLCHGGIGIGCSCRPS